MNYYTISFSYIVNNTIPRGEIASQAIGVFGCKAIDFERAFLLFRNYTQKLTWVSITYVHTEKIADSEQTGQMSETAKTSNNARDGK